MSKWAVIEPVLPPPACQVGRGRPELHPRRLILDAVFYLVAEGVRWRALPVGFPPWQTVYGFFTRWRDDGTWQRVHDVLSDRVRVQEGRGVLPTAAVIDSQSVKARRDRRGRPGWVRRRQEDQRDQAARRGRYPRPAAGRHGHRRRRPGP